MWGEMKWLLSPKYVVQIRSFHSAPHLFTKGLLLCRRFLRFFRFHLPLTGAPAAKATPQLSGWWNQGPNDLLLLRLGGSGLRHKPGDKIKMKSYGAAASIDFPFYTLQPILEMYNELPSHTRHHSQIVLQNAGRHIQRFPKMGLSPNHPFEYDFPF